MNAGQSSQKQYGLIKPAKKSQTSAIRPSIFNNDSSSGDESAPAQDWGKAALKSISHGSVQAAQTRKVIRQAMQEDASLFQYDEVYDDMQQQKQNKVETKKTVDNKPRYMQKLLQSAEQRRHQQERRIERQVQLEREREGDEFADKEQFVTDAYRQRLLERKEEEEKERRIQQIEEINDVTKQKDLGSFYRHMYQKANAARSDADDVKPEPGETSETAVKVEPGSEPTSPAAPGRQYRARRVSSSPEPDRSEPAASERRHRRRRRSPSGDRDRSRSRDPERRRDGGEERSERRRSDADSDSSSGSGSDGEGQREPPPPPPSQPARPRASSAERAARRRALYDKRTVGEVFEAARQRYLERREARANGPSPVSLQA
ncbi:nuclear speckle splicing regulatory protein 1-like isoform X1 [Amphibalanus amphitrite]|uniref:nuclear speckle splicing regulatory protein 1-like isoform X1 n=2 Tax=Amphibalanus amphitrite TaxID=1232801 RepID=UPI001C9070F8|nr:nuclear speckle splicing regulatory protein 1-like isoform X1 [Amphibalanus amphitrite]XP_043216633.1 nuclear speckle splicing regulatory protein 1-like isoform X1 [Amphibalanus amphitrite]XP_043216634.1 nuclear speckle splicing regulatory protein 1-like isoform X1 [Amphibalanus amphitrite]XP_043216635.1 nuclear speckle splicing regulatory protein 1-like isoform X1 [Amphibalanus amphitrite]XP_043216636.1 nuclear speckle splicing regulatory protein 1-like isoform X1 [Amphibalanus amphitrite]